MKKSLSWGLFVFLLTLGLPLPLISPLTLASQGGRSEEGVKQEEPTREEEGQEILFSEAEKHQEGPCPRLERKHSLGAIQQGWEGAPSTAGAYGVTYSQKEVIRLRLREFMTTTVVLPSWEKIEDIIIGDASTFDATKATDHILLLKTKEFIGADSTITVIGGSGLVYTFYVRSEGFNTTPLPHLRVHVHVPGDVPRSFPDTRKHYGQEKGGNHQTSSGLSSPQDDKALVAQSDYPSSLPPRMDRLNFQWSMSGDPSIAPQQVFSDGIRTWFNFGSHLEEQDLPVVSRVIDGVDTPINTRLEGSLVIAESVGVFTLRNGKRVVCVYPSSLKEG